MANRFEIYETIYTEVNTSELTTAPSLKDWIVEEPLERTVSLKDWIAHEDAMNKGHCVIDIYDLMSTRELIYLKNHNEVSENRSESLDKVLDKYLAKRGIYTSGLFKLASSSTEEEEVEYLI